MNPLDLIGEPLTSIYFAVMIDNMGLGKWSKVEGLGITFKNTTGVQNPGGWGASTHNMVDTIVFPPVKLTRPVGPATADILHWLRSYAKQVSKTTALIMAIDPICPWVY